MKKTAILTLSLLIGGLAYGQSSIKGEAKQGLTVADKPAKVVNHHQTEANSAAIIWSEDFANGIPSTWSQAGSPSTALWVYRGPNTTPDNTIGSQGAFDAAQTPINSPTASNGFVIFDSDFYDTGGDPTQQGNGTVPVPHTGVLETDVIDLTGHPNVEVTMSTLARNFDSDMLVAVSKDGGSTFPDTVRMLDLNVNETSANGARVNAIISATAGNESNVVLQFIFDGATATNPNGPGYYYWQFDDVNVRDVPDHRLEFTETFVNGNPAPPIDYLPGMPGQPKYGIWNTEQLRPIGADANIVNTGAMAQTNVKAELQIWNAATASVVQTLSSPTNATLAPGDTLDFNNLTMTSSWTPPKNNAAYLLVWRTISDSIGPGKPGMEGTDTANIFVSDNLYGLDDREIDNFVGTNSLASGEITGAIVQYDFDNAVTSGGADILGVEIALSGATDSLGDIEIQVFDTVGFFGTPTPLWSQLFPLSGGVVGTVAQFNFTQKVNVPAPGSYYIRVNFFPTTGNVVRLANSGTWDQPGLTSLMVDDAGAFFTGFNNSRSFEAPHIRAMIDNGIGVDEFKANNAFIAFPNPTSGSLNLRAGVSGKYELSVINMVGQVVREESVEMTAGQLSTRDFSELQAGVYLLNVVGEGLNETIKLTIK